MSCVVFGLLKVKLVKRATVWLLHMHEHVGVQDAGGICGTGLCTPWSKLHSDTVCFLTRMLRDIKAASMRNTTRYAQAAASTTYKRCSVDNLTLSV
jgi:hypothetical protein